MTIASMAEFARQQGWDRSYVTRLKQADRLVMQGDRVDVEASPARIAATASLQRQDVASRHAAARSAAAPPETTNTAPAAPTSPNNPPTAAPDAPNPASAAEPPAAPDEDRLGTSYHAARSVKEKYLALTAKADYERQIGQLVDAYAVEAAMKHVGAAARSAMDNFPDQVAPLVVATQTVDAARAVLEAQCRNFLHNFVDLIEKQVITLQAGT
jgi:hypothetical protein